MTVTVEDCMRVVMREFGVTREQLVGKDLHRNLVRPRQITCWLACKATKFSTTQIGRRLDGLDHTTVLYARRHIEDLRAYDKSFTTLTDRLLLELIETESVS